MTRTLLMTVLLVAGVVQAQPAPPNAPGGPPPPPPGGPISPEALATVPDLTAAQQVEVRRILIQRRDAHDAVRAKERSERDTQMARVRAEHERIDDASSEQLRKLLGDDGYRTLAQWQTQPPPPRGPGRALPTPPPVAGTLDPVLALPRPPGDDDDELARVR